jgi:hypothetical protein
MVKEWVDTPTADALMNTATWAGLGGDRFGAARYLLLVDKRVETKPYNGPAFESDLPAGAKHVVSKELSWTLQHTDTVQDSVTSTVKINLSTTLLAKLGAKAEAGIPGLKAALTAEIESKLGAELERSLSSNLTTTRAYSIQAIEKTTETIEFNVPAPADGALTRKLFSYQKFKKHVWDIFLYSVDVIDFSYAAPSLLKKGRLDVQSTVTVVPRVPLARVEFFLPVPKSSSWVFDTYTPEVADPDLVTAVFLGTPYPDAPPLPAMFPLTELAHEAFPTKKAAKKAAAVKKSAVKKAAPAKRVAAKKAAPAKKAATKRATPANKLAAKKATAKKAAPAKKLAAKKAVPAKKSAAPP